MARPLDAGVAMRSVAQLNPGGENLMRHLLAAISVAALTSTASVAAPPALTPAQHDATHAMFEHVINTPTVIGRHNVPAMAQFVADQFKAGGFPAEDVHVMPYHTGSAT